MGRYMMFMEEGKIMYKELLDLLLEMEEHRARYSAENAKDGNEYWSGRRDEAGYFRDKLKSILENRDSISIPFVQIPPYLDPPWKITTTGDDVTKYVTYSTNNTKAE